MNDEEDAGVPHSIWVQKAGEMYWRDGRQFPYSRNMVGMCDCDREVVRRFASRKELDEFIAQLIAAADEAWPNDSENGARE